MKNKLLLLGKAIAITAFWIAVWYLLCLKVDQPLLLPSPLAVIRELMSLVVTLSFWKTVFCSFFHVLSGIFLAMAAGILLAVLCSFSRLLSDFVTPLITVIRTTPVASFIILVLIWIGASNVPILIGFLMVLPVYFTQLTDGIGALDPELREVCRVFRLTPAQKIRRYYVPSLTPYFLSACRTSIGLAWKAGVAAEVLASSPGSIGLRLFESKLYLDMTELFAWTLTVIVLSLLIEAITVRLIAALQKKSRRNLHA